MSKTGGGENFHYLPVVKYDRHLRDRFARSSANHSLVDLTNIQIGKVFFYTPEPPNTVQIHNLLFEKPPKGGWLVLRTQNYAHYALCLDSRASLARVDQSAISWLLVLRQYHHSAPQRSVYFMPDLRAKAMHFLICS